MSRFFRHAPFRHLTATASIIGVLAVAASTAVITSASASQNPASQDLAPQDSVTSAAASPITLADSSSDRPPYDTWISDVTAVTDKASAYLANRLPDQTIKPAIILDIDNTALETAYRGVISTPATPPVLELAQKAHDAGAAIIFVTARPEILKSITVHNLHDTGYTVDGLYMREFLDTSSNEEVKTNARTQIESDGYTIVANIGNNDSDLVGGHAEQTFKLPDYNGRLS
jgi:hypothetical protein